MAARSTAGAIDGGLDVAMPGPQTVYGPALAEAVRAGRGRRVRRGRGRAQRAAPRRPRRHPGGRPRRRHRAPGRPIDGQALAREIAARAFVLVRNERRRGALPLDAAPAARSPCIGAAARDARERERVASSIAEILTWLKRRTGTDDTAECLANAAICGFTICPPTGGNLSQTTIHDALDGILSSGVPASLYQLPQVTENEMSAETLIDLAARHPNFYMFKDTSGGDLAVKGGFRDAFLVRGAEGNYVSHLAEAGGAYDGFLLSTANCFGQQLACMIDDASQGRRPDAEEILLRSPTFAADCSPWRRKWAMAMPSPMLTRQWIISWRMVQVP